MEFNINHYVSVKLTDEGKAEHERQHGELKEMVPSLSDYKSPAEDAEGWSKWQMWSLMNTFGHMLHNGGKVPFDTTIKLDVKEQDS